MKITKKNNATRERYLKTKPKFLGNLHERMKLVMEIMQKEGAEKVGNELWEAIFDLQLEVSCHEPANPPFGKRTIEMKEFIRG